jgi:YidC/Oxa1 family membrane protein insertase
LNRSVGNYFFSAADVGHFLDANLFGAPIGASMIQTAGLGAFTEFHRGAVIAVGAPLMILAGVATYFNSRASVARQSPEASANPQTAMMNKLALYVFPLGVVVGGPFLPLAIILYWVSNNIWTFGQQHYVFGMIEKKEEEKKRVEQERRAANAPAPGARPKKKRPPKPPEDGGAAAVEQTESTATEVSSAVEPPAGEETSINGSANGSATKPSTTAPGARNGATNRTPRNKANNRPRKRR